MKRISREDFYQEYTDYTVNTMDEETLKQIAQITLMPNINPETLMKIGKMLLHR